MDLIAAVLIQLVPVILMGLIALYLVHAIPVYAAWRGLQRLWRLL